MWDRLVRVDEPDLPISVSAFRARLGLIHESNDSELDTAIRAASGAIEGPQGIGIALAAQKWQAVLQCFPIGAICIPLWPLVSVETITYLDSDDASQTVAGFQVDPLSGSVLPLPNESWPATSQLINAVTIDFTVGYEEIPHDLRRAVETLAAHYFENVEAVVVGQGTTAVEIPLNLQAIFERYRRGRFW